VDEIRTEKKATKKMKIGHKGKEKEGRFPGCDLVKGRGDGVKVRQKRRKG